MSAEFWVIGKRAKRNKAFSNQQSPHTIEMPKMGEAEMAETCKWQIEKWKIYSFIDAAWCSSSNSSSTQLYFDLGDHFQSSYNLFESEHNIHTHTHTRVIVFMSTSCQNELRFTLSSQLLLHKGFFCWLFVRRRECAHKIITRNRCHPTTDCHTAKQKSPKLNVTLALHSRIQITKCVEIV